MKTSEILRAAKAVIEDQEHWIQGTYGRRSRSSKDHLLGNDPEATCWCSMGAIQKVTNSESDYRMELFLNDVVRKVTKDPFMGIIRYNDHHTHAEVMKMFDRAIEMAEEEEKNAA